MLTEGIRGSDAHDTQHHPIDQAHSPAANAAGTRVYVVCDWNGCAQRLAVDGAVWEAEVARRRALSDGVQVWHARGDRLVPVAPDACGLVPRGHTTPNRARNATH